jgi:thiamine-phosphate pyrophosphorylase
MTDFGLYVIITNPTLPYTTIAEMCVKNGIKMLQLREKKLPDKELIRIGRQIKQITKGSGTSLVINDRPDMAVLCEADYLHLGQDDLPIEEARRIVGDMKIGLSTHSYEQAVAALAKNPAYIGFGPIYSTPTKAIPDRPVGTAMLRQVLEIAQVPVVAIGGLFPENIQSVMEAGARNIAMVRYLMQTDAFEERIQSINHLLTKTP